MDVQVELRCSKDSFVSSVVPPQNTICLPLDTLQLRFPLMLFSGAFLVIPHRQKLIMVIGRCVHLRATLPNVHNVLHVFARTCHVRRYSGWSIDPRHYRLPLLAVVVCFQHLLNKWGVLCLAILPAQTTPENNHLPLVANCSFYSTKKCNSDDVRISDNCYRRTT